MTTSTRWQFIIVVASLVAIAFKAYSYVNPMGLIYGVPAEDLLLLCVATIGGFPLIIEILLKLLRGQFGADLLAAIAILTALYLEEFLAADLIVLMLAGGAVFESFAVRKASSVLLALADRMPSKAFLKKADQIQELALSEIKLDDMLIVYPHETCPVDGVVVEGQGHMNEAYLTGEPYNIPKAPGSSVISGSTNGDKLLVIRATKLPEDSRYSKIMQIMEEAEQRRPTLRRLGDQVGAIFTPFALAIALGAWYITGDSVRFLAVLVIATPCPLLIAIPVTIISAISMASRRGIIIKDPVVLERLPTCQTAIFDKTGTLTYGEPEVVDILMLNEFEKSSTLQLAASLERYSKHPLAQAIIRAARKDKLKLLMASEVSEKPGQGLTGQINDKTVQLTDRKHLKKQHPDQHKLLPDIRPGLECLVVVDQKLAAVVQLRDTIRKEGGAFINHLGPIHNFKKVMIVSGDRPEEVEYLAKELHITETHANQTPEQKVEIVKSEVLKAPTLYVGDGINDAPALVSATVGLAFGKASSVTAEAGGAVLFESSLAKVDELLHISTSMRRIALQSAVGGMVLSVIGMWFAALGYIPPVAGALLQEGIDVIAILNALRMTIGKDIDADIKDD